MHSAIARDCTVLNLTSEPWVVPLEYQSAKQSIRVYCRRKSLRFPMLTLTPRPRHSARAFGNSKTLPYARLAVTASDGMTDFTTQDPVVRQQIIHAYTQSIGTIWLVNAPLVGAGLLMGTSPFVL